MLIRHSFRSQVAQGPAILCLFLRLGVKHAIVVSFMYEFFVCEGIFRILKGQPPMTPSSRCSSRASTRCLLTRASSHTPHSPTEGTGTAGTPPFVNGSKRRGAKGTDIAYCLYVVCAQCTRDCPQLLPEAWE